jgi:hypothetical protein
MCYINIMVIELFANLFLIQLFIVISRGLNMRVHAPSLNEMFYHARPFPIFTCVISLHVIIIYLFHGQETHPPQRKREA